MQAQLTPEAISAAAQLLTNARKSVDVLSSLGDFEPLDLASAHAIAEAHAASLGWDTIGWKVGCTSQEAMEILNSPGPFAGRIFDGTAYQSGSLHEYAMHNPGVECEFAFVIGRDLPPRTTMYTVEDVQKAIVAVAPAVELVAPRFEDFTGVGVLSLIADSGANAGVVLGEPVMVVDCPELSTVAVELSIDGSVVSSGTGSAILGDPWRALEWLANHLSARQIGLRAGEFVLSGTCTGIDPLAPGSTATAAHSGFAPVTVMRTSESNSG